jgi:hypothetical protein
MLESIDRWENEGGRHASEATTANSRSFAAGGGTSDPTAAVSIAAELCRPAAPPPMSMSGLEHLRETPWRVAWGASTTVCRQSDTFVKR